MVSRFKTARERIQQARGRVLGELNRLRLRRQALESQRNELDSIRRQLSTQEAVRGVGGLSALLQRNEELSRISDVRQRIQANIDQLQSVESSFSPIFSQLTAQEREIKLVEKAIGRRTELAGEVRAEARAELEELQAQQLDIPISQVQQMSDLEKLKSFSPQFVSLQESSLGGFFQPAQQTADLSRFQTKVLSPSEFQQVLSEKKLESQLARLEQPSQIDISGVISGRDVGAVSLPEFERGTIATQPEETKLDIRFVTGEPPSVPLERQPQVTQAQPFRFFEPSSPLPTQILQALGRGTEFVVQKFKGRQDVIGQESVFFRPTGIPAEAVGGLIFGGIASPVLASGAVTAQSQLISKPKSLQQLFRELADALSESRIVTTASRDAELREITRQLIRKVLDSGDKKALARLKNFYRESGRLDLFEDLLQQESGMLKGFRPVQEDVPSTITGAGQITGEVPSIVRPFEGKAKGEVRGVLTEFEEQTAFQGSVLDSSQSPFFRPAITPLAELQVQQPAQDIQQQLRQSLGLSQQQPTRQTSGQLVGLASALGFRQAEQQQQRFRVQQLLRTRTGEPRPKPRPRRPRQPARPTTPPALPISTGVGVLKSAIQKIKRSGKSFDVFVKRRGKFEKVGDDLPFFRALKKGRDITDATLSAQFKLLPQKTMPKQKDIKPFQLNPKKFRDFKIIKGKKQKLPLGHFIEKRNARLDSKSEVAEILGIKRKKRK